MRIRGELEKKQGYRFLVRTRTVLEMRIKHALPLPSTRFQFLSGSSEDTCVNIQQNLHLDCVANGMSEMTSKTLSLHLRQKSVPVAGNVLKMVTKQVSPMAAAQNET